MGYFFSKRASYTYHCTFYILVASLSIFCFSNKSLQIVLKRDFVKMKVIVYLIGNQTRRANVSITITLPKLCSISLAYITACFNFHKKDSGTLLPRFFKWSMLRPFQFLSIFFSMSTIFLISSISLYSIYCYRFK